MYLQKDLSLVDSFANRTLDSFKEMGILDRYVGTVCHDHNNIHFIILHSQNKQNVIFHILRYCKKQNIEVHKREIIKSNLWTTC